MPRGRTCRNSFFSVSSKFLQAVLYMHVYVWVRGVPFSLPLIRHMCGLTLQWRRRLRVRVDYRTSFVGTCSHLQHDAVPDRGKCVMPCRNGGWALGLWWETWGQSSPTHGASSSRVLATILASCAPSRWLIVLHFAYGSADGVY
jgi:hypothetical protein